MKVPMYLRSQSGFTLIEVIITSAVGLILMTALTSVILTSVRAAGVATGRVEASSQIRNFELRAYDDFARSGIPAIPGCGDSAADACTTSIIVLSGVQASNTNPPSITAYTVTYQWDGRAFLDRAATGVPREHMATSVTSFTWYVDNTSARPTVVTSLTVTVQNYSETQTFRFYPRLNP